MQNKCKAAYSIVEDEGEESVIDEVAIHDAAPEEVAICKQGESVSSMVAEVG